MMKDAMARVAKKKATAESAAALGTASDEAVSQDEGCPLDKGELGNATWGLVRAQHRLAASLHTREYPSVSRLLKFGNCERMISGMCK